MVTGIDLIKEQIRMAVGEPLRLKQDDVQLSGWSIECRINAADALNGFAPSPGRILTYQQPGGPDVRVDTHVHAGYDVPPFYDSLLAKLIVHSRSRQDAIHVMRRALDEYVIEPIKTTIPLHKQILSDPTFARGHYATNYLERLLGTAE
jgi:biotin carboxylase